jgi:hypothetical protein
MKLLVRLRRLALVGAPKAITATARKLGCLIYRLIKTVKVTKHPICTFMNLNTNTKSSILYATIQFQDEAMEAHLLLNFSATARSALRQLLPKFSRASARWMLLNTSG